MLRGSATTAPSSQSLDYFDCKLFLSQTFPCSTRLILLIGAMSNKTWDATIRQRIETFQETLPDSPGVRNYDEILKKRVALQEKVQSLTGNKRHEAESELRAVTLQFEKEFERQCNTYKACRDFLRGLIRDNLPESREYLKELLAKETPIASQTEMSQTPPQSPIHTENVLESHFNVEADDSQPFNDETNASNTITKSPLISAKDSKIVRVSESLLTIPC